MLFFSCVLPSCSGEDFTTEGVEDDCRDADCGSDDEPDDDIPGGGGGAGPDTDKGSGGASTGGKATGGNPGSGGTGTGGKATGGTPGSGGIGGTGGIDGTGGKGGAPPVDDPVSDDFNSCVLDESIWTRVDPNGLTSIVTDAPEGGGGTLRIRLPDGQAHDPYLIGTDPEWVNRTPRIVQAMPDENFIVSSKFDSPVEQNGNGQGIVIELAGEDILRFDFTGNDSGGANLFVGVLGPGGVRVSELEPLESVPSSYVLRVVRTGDDWAFSWKASGGDFVVFHERSMTATVEAVGVEGINAYGAAHEAVVDWFDYKSTMRVNADGVTQLCSEL